LRCLHGCASFETEGAAGGGRNHCARSPICCALVNSALKARNGSNELGLRSQNAQGSCREVLKRRSPMESKTRRSFRTGTAAILDVYQMSKPCFAEGQSREGDPRMWTCWSRGCPQQTWQRSKQRHHLISTLVRLLKVHRPRVPGNDGPARGGIAVLPSCSSAGAKTMRLPPSHPPFISLSNLGSLLVTLGCGLGLAAALAAASALKTRRTPCRRGMGFATPQQVALLLAAVLLASALACQGRTLRPEPPPCPPESWDCGSTSQADRLQCGRLGQKCCEFAGEDGERWRPGWLVKAMALPARPPAALRVAPLHCCPLTALPLVSPACRVYVSVWLRR
jgi:hypothetical protein